ncbi:LysR family transcriptional regulator [Fusibacter ferrireducens]|uniref:LysR family transcriptional regulator n=1 Tax=Fusibacter ferrireducens TaxID=2785058 RepID=A0ABR9ZW41_9FIRM|nr:LysR family transcriptional regulator [Fusibacter ferrireducens]MBF4694658.1 LysR family transcriptional regulator [Fusibacter ferrireducens]
MDYNLLITFIYLAQFKNFTKTAEQLHVVQSTVTSRIKQLEYNLGETLFTRTNKTVELTQKGEAFLPYAKELLSLQDTALSQLKQLEIYQDTLTIGVVHSIYECHVAHLILKFIQNNPKISVKVMIGHSEELIQGLHENQLDIAFTYWDVKSSQFTCEPFHNDEIILVTGAQNKCNSEGVSNETLKSLQLWKSAIYTESFKEWFYTIFPKNYLYAMDINVSGNTIAYLEAGIGYGFMLKSMVTKNLEAGSLIEVKLLESSPPCIESYILINKRRLTSEAVKQWLLECE